jgi:O-antigen/teichoic acid export membrane protein
MRNLFKKMKNRQLLSNILIASTFDIFAKISNVIVIILIIRLLSKEEYSNFVLFQSISAFFIGTFTNGLNLSYVRYESERYSQQKSSFGILYRYNLIINLIVYLICLLAFILFSNFNSNFNGGILETIVVLSIIYACSMSFIYLGQSYYQSKGEFKFAGIIINLNNLLVLFSLIIVLVFSGITFTTISIAYIISSLLIAIYVTNNIYKKIKIKSKAKKGTIYKKFLNDSVWLILYCLFLALFGQVDIFMISYFLSKDELATYGVAFRYYNIFLTLLPSIMAVLRVRTSRIDMINDITKQREFTLNWIKKGTPLVLLLVFIATLLSSYVFPILNGQTYNLAIPIFQILCIGVALSYIFAPNVSVLMSLKKYKYLSLIGFIALFINLLGNFLFIPTFGLYAAAITTIISHGFINIYSTILVMKYTKK